jgi:hypothetical protein
MAAVTLLLNYVIFKSVLTFSENKIFPRRRFCEGKTKEFLAMFWDIF